MHPCTLCTPAPLHPTRIPAACSSAGARSTPCPGALRAAEQPPRPTPSPVTRSQGAIITRSPHAAANIYRSPCAPVLGFGRTPCLPPGNVIGAAPSWGSSGGVALLLFSCCGFWVRFCKQAEGTAGHAGCASMVVPALGSSPWAAKYILGCREAPMPCLGGLHAPSTVLPSTRKAPPHYVCLAPQKRSHFVGTKGDAPYKPHYQLGVAHSSP